MIHRAILLLFLALSACNGQGGHIDRSGSPQAVRRANAEAARIIRQQGELGDWQKAYKGIPCADCVSRSDITNKLQDLGFQGSDCLWYKKDNNVYIVYVYCGSSQAFIIARRVWGEASISCTAETFFELWGTPDLWVN